MSAKFIEEIFDKLMLKVIENNNQIPNEVIGNLISLFDKSFIDCIPMIDNKTVSMIKSSNDRILFRVDSNEGSKQTTIRNFCLIDSNYCNCSAFCFQGIKNEEIFWCKHLIAAKLSNAMKCYEIIEITDEEMKKILMENVFNY